jgi:hypothetical protein
MLAVKRFVHNYNITMEGFDAAARRSREHLPSAGPRLTKLVRLSLSTDHTYQIFTKLLYTQRHLLQLRQNVIYRLREEASNVLALSLKRIQHLAPPAQAYSYDMDPAEYDETGWRTRSLALTAAFYLWEEARSLRTSAAMAELEASESGQFGYLEEDEEVHKAFLRALRSQLDCSAGLPDRL